MCCWEVKHSTCPHTFCILLFLEAICVQISFQLGVRSEGRGRRDCDSYLQNVWKIVSADVCYLIHSKYLERTKLMSKQSLKKCCAFNLPRFETLYILRKIKDPFAIQNIITGQKSCPQTQIMFYFSICASCQL